MGAEQPRTENQGDGPQNDGKDCYISKIPNEILLSIFNLNSNMDEEELRLDDFERVNPFQLHVPGNHEYIDIKETARPIISTRNSSQVNTTWRDLILSTLALWANLIDILFLDCVGDYFREEVIRRTKNAPLHVKGRIHVESRSGTGPWLTSFLNHNWERIRHFDVRVCDRETEVGTFIEYSNAAVYRKVLSCLSRPATALESFTIDFPGPCDPLAEGSVLFCDSAPQLRSFQTKCMILSIDECSWLPQLQEFRVFECYSPPFSSVGAFYNILSQMTNLEFLSLENAIGSPQIAPECPQIRLPRLRKLQIREDDRQIDNNSRRKEANGSICWPLLSTIFPNAGCSIEIILDTPHPNDINIPLLSQWASNYFQVIYRCHLDFGVNDKEFWFMDINSFSHNAFHCHELGRFLCINLKYRGPNQRESAFYQMLQGLSFLSFPQIKSVAILLNNEYASPAFSDPQFSSFFSSFSSVEKLSTVPTTLDAISSSSFAETSILFPHLKHLTFYFFKQPTEYEIGRSGYATYALETVFSFLNHRVNACLPISKFVYQARNINPPNWMADMTFLDQFTGLKVEWVSTLLSSGSYICGSGNPDILDFPQRLIRIKKSRQRFGGYR